MYRKYLLPAFLISTASVIEFTSLVYSQQIIPEAATPPEVKGSANDLPVATIAEPRLKDNKDLPDSKLLLSKDKLSDTSNLPKGTKLVKVEKKTFGDVEAEQGGARFYDVAKGRQVYEQVIHYPEYFHPQLGKMTDVTTTFIIDAETGEPIQQTFYGKPAEDVRPVLPVQ